MIRPSRGSVVVRGTVVPWAVVLAALVALGAKLFLASTTFGTTDVRAFLYFFRRDAATGPVSVYEMVKDFNHPPSMIFALRGIHGLAEATGIPFSFWLRIPAILADVGSILLVAMFLRPARAAAKTPLVLCAVAPISVFVSGFHGNTDPVMIFLVLLSIAILDRSRPAWLAGLVFGLALDVKVVPLVFAPAILLWLPDWKRRLEYFGAALLVVLATWAPVLFASPALVARRVFGYGSSYGIWGLSRILVLDLLREHGRILLAAVVVAFSVWMNREGWMNSGGRKVPLFRQAGVVAFAFLAVTPGFGVQYLAWLVPFTAALPTAWAVSFHAASGAFLAAVYTFWCQRPLESAADPNWLGKGFWTRGLPWDVANANRIGAWRGELVILEVVCWLAVVAAFASLLRGAAADPATESTSALPRETA